MFKKIVTLITTLAATLATTLALAAVDVNKATQADLDGIKGIGPATAEKILKERKNGDFKDWADLETRVPGIKDKRAAKLSAAGLTVGGASYAGAPAATTSNKKAAGKKAADAPVAPAAPAVTAPATPAAPASAPTKK